METPNYQIGQKSSEIVEDLQFIKEKCVLKNSVWKDLAAVYKFMELVEEASANTKN